MCLNDHIYTHKFILRYFLKQKHNHVRTRRQEDTMHAPVAHMSTRKRSLAPCPGYIMLIKVRLYQQSTALTLAWSESEIHTLQSLTHNSRRVRQSPDMQTYFRASAIKINPVLCCISDGVKLNKEMASLEADRYKSNGMWTQVEAWGCLR